MEGVSYLLLLGIAMPMKYFFGMPLAVRTVGMAHGVLFLAYCLLLAVQMKKHGWKFSFVLYLFIATLLPFGTFVTYQKLAKIQAD